MSDVAAPGFLEQVGPMGELYRRKDWSATALGPPAQWSSELRGYVDMMLRLPEPAIIFWGADQLQLYNLGYSAIMGPRHPRYLGEPYRDCWPDTYSTIYPMMRRVMDRGEVVQVTDALIPLTRYGFTEETYFTFSFVPLRGKDGRIEGFIQPITETTRRVIAERRLATVGALAPRVGSAGDAISDATAAFAANDRDVPFAVVFVLDDVTQELRLAAQIGLADVTPAMTESAAQVAKTLTPELVAVDALAQAAHLGPWPEPVRQAMLLPLRRWEGEAARGVLILGISSRLTFDSPYRAFFESAARELASNLAFEQENREKARLNLELQRRADALTELDRAKTAFFSNISHEFRTPLTLMLGPTEDALARAGGVLAGEELRTVYRNELRLLKLVNSLLDFSRLEAGRVQAQHEEADLAQLTFDLASAFRAAMERAGLTFEVDCPARLLCWVDRTMWEKVVLNLLSNALKFTFAGTVRLTLVADGAHVELRVADTGTGIAEQELPHLFERFHRVEGARSRTHEGSGIGLALVHELVKLQGGTIAVLSELDVGTTFIIRLPIRPPEARAHAPAPAAPSAPSHSTSAYVEEALRWLPGAADAELGPAGAASAAAAASIARSDEAAVRLLVADDNADMRDYLRRLLSQRWHVDAVADGAAALAAARHERPDLIVTDVMMPNLDGFGLLRALRAEPALADIPVIMLSARAGDEARVEGIEAGADDYLVKPFAARELVARVATHLQLARLRAESAEVGQRLRQLLMQSPVAVAVLRGPEYRFELANPRYLEMVARSDIEGRAFVEVFPEVADTPLIGVLARVYQGESFVTEEYVTPLVRDGRREEAVFKFNLVPTRDAKNQVIGLICMAVEITEQVRARARLDAVIEHLPIGLTITSRDGHISRVNTALMQMWKAAEPPAGITLDEYQQYVAYHSDGRPLALDDWPNMRVLHTGQEVHLEALRFRRWDGSEGWMRVDGVPLKDPSGAVREAVVTSVDITEQVRTAAALEQARAAAEQGSRAKDAFLAMLGHELRNPLAPILTALELMRLRDGQSVERERAVIERQARHMARLVDDLLDVSRITQGKIKLERRPLELASIISRAIETAAPLLEQRRHSLQTAVPPHGCVVQGDAARLTQIFSNLINNAAKYTDAGGIITLSASRQGDEIVARVADNGRGISAAMLPHVFELFAQEQQNLDRSQGGLGLGLAIVKSLVALHGGSVFVRSEGVGCGSEFEVRLPAAGVAPTTAPPGEAPLAHLPPSTRAHVLIVDDNEDAAELLSQSLDLLGFTTAVAHDAAQALRRIERFTPEVALLDIGLPVIDGYELGTRLRERLGPGLRLVALTGYGQESDRRRSQEAGFDGHLVKPIELPKLEEILETLTRSAATR